MSQCRICGKEIGILKNASYVDGKKACYDCWIRSMKSEIAKEHGSYEESNAPKNQVVIEATTEYCESTLEDKQPQSNQQTSSKKGVFVGIGVAVVLIFSLVFYAQSTSPSGVARRFFKASMNGDYKAAASLCTPRIAAGINSYGSSEKQSGLKITSVDETLDSYSDMIQVTIHFEDRNRGGATYRKIIFVEKIDGLWKVVGFGG